MKKSEKEIYDYLFEGKNISLAYHVYFFFKKNEKATLIKKVAYKEMISRSRSLSEHIHSKGGTYVLNVLVNPEMETYLLELRFSSNNKKKMDATSIICEKPIGEVAEVAKIFLRTMKKIKNYEVDTNQSKVGLISTF